MVRVNTSYPDFSAGEVSPKMYGRHDLAAFYNGGRRVENFVTEVAGAARYRTGMVYSSEAQNNEQAYLHPFIYSDTLSYVMEFTDTKLRFHDENGLVTETPQSILDITKANPAVLEYAGADTYANGDRVLIRNTQMSEVNFIEATVANVNVGANTFELQGIDSTGYEDFFPLPLFGTLPTVAKIVEVTTPFAAADLQQLKFSPVLNGDMYIAHPSYNPQKLTFTSATNWTIANHAPTALTLTANNRPSAVGVYEQRLVYGGSNNNPNRLWFSKSANFNDFTTGTAATDGLQYDIAGAVGRILWIEATDEFLSVGSAEDVYKVSGGIDNVLTPDSISIKPTKTFGVADIMPVGRGNQIMYAQSNQLVVRSYEYVDLAGSYKPIDRNTIADHITSSGITQIAFEEGRPNILWATKTNGGLIGMTVEDSEQISGWHRHTTDGNVKSVAAIPRNTQYNQVYVCVEREINGSTKYFIEYFADTVNNVRREDFVDGTEAADKAKFENLIFENQKAYVHLDSCWSYYGDAENLAQNIAVTPSATTGTGVTFTASNNFFNTSMTGNYIIRKSIDGTQEGKAEIKTYTSSTAVECDILEDFDSTAQIPAGEWYLTIGGFEEGELKHLEGETVTIVTDGGQHPNKVVTDGKVTLDQEASVVHVGLPYKGYLETNDLEGGGTTGVAQTKKKNVYAVGFRFLDTLYAQYGTGYYNLEDLEVRTASMKMDRPPVLFTGDAWSQFNNEINDAREGGWSRQKRVIISQEQPFPCNVQLIIPYFNVSN